MSRIVPRFDFRVTFAAQTDVGAVRKRNEDAWLLAPEQALFGIADGMGGLSDGALAARMALDAAHLALSTSEASALLDTYVSDPKIENRRAVFTLLRSACLAANRDVLAASNARLSEDADPRRGMGATLDLVLLVRDRAFFAHAGDGRIYLARPTTTLQVTNDHGLDDRMLSSGAVHARTRRSGRSPLVNAIGLSEQLQVETVFVEIGRGDRVVLVTDGVYQTFESEAEFTKLCAERDADQLATALVELARQRGSRDNATAVVVQIGERFLSRTSDQSPQAQDLVVISNCPLVMEMPPWAVLETLAAGVEVEIAKGDRVPQMVARDLCAYLVVDGMIEISDKRVLSQGALLFPESLVGVPVVGELPLVIESCRLVRLRHDDFTEICAHNADLAAGLYMRLSRHLALTR